MPPRRPPARARHSAPRNTLPARTEPWSDFSRRDSQNHTRAHVRGPRGLLRGAVLGLVIALVYANSLSGAFVLDDQAAIVQNTQIQDLSRVSDLVVPAPDSPVAGRPLAHLSFALNYAAGGLDVRGYHVVNIAVHILCALLVLTLVRQTVARWNVTHDGRLDAPGIATGAALLWGVHPLNTEVVDYLSQRTESLMAACYLTAVYAAIRASDADGSGRRRWEAFAALACIAGALCKESIVTAPVIVAIYDRVFLFESWRAQWIGRRRLYAGLAGSWIVVGLLLADGPRAAVVGFSSGVTPWVYLLNQAPIIIHYLRLAIWPDALVAFYGWPLPVTLADTAPYVAMVGSLFVLSGIALWRWPALGFLGAWFFVTLAPASSLVPVSTEVGAERRMYLPLVALAVLAAIAADAATSRIAAGSGWSRERAGQSGRLSMSSLVRLRPPVIVLVAAALLAMATVARNREYGSPLTLAQTIVDRRPSPVARHMLGEELVRAGRVEDAIPHLRAAVAEGNSRARYLLGRVLASREEHDEAVEQLEAFLRTYRPAEPLVPKWLEPPLAEVVPARFLLGRAYGLRGDWDRAEAQARWILDLVPGHVGARVLIADAMFARQQWGAAAEHYRAYLQRQPNDVRALMNYGVTQIGLERLDAAVDAFGRASALEPANARAKELLAMAEQDRASLSAGR